MENENKKSNELLIKSRSSEKKESFKSCMAEPEMEDFSDTELVKNIAQELGISDLLLFSQEQLVHDPMLMESCPHCKVLEKINSLQNDIVRMNLELRTTNQILNEKKAQNFEMNGMIKRLEENIGGNLQERKNKGFNCSCFNKCFVF
jgi:hypothetical protein